MDSKPSRSPEDLRRNRKSTLAKESTRPPAEASPLDTGCGTVLVTDLLATELLRALQPLTFLKKQQKVQILEQDVE